MKNDTKPDTLAVINNYNFNDRHTHIRTWRLYDRPGPEGRVGENENSVFENFYLLQQDQQNIIFILNIM